jgi:phenylacetate-CoA ligase
MQLLRHLPRFRRASRELPVLAGREGWSRGDIESFQLGRLNAAWGRAIRNVAYYRELRESRPGLPERFGSLAEFRAVVPILQKDAVRDRPERFLADAPEPGVWRRTGGSTGSPMRVYWSHEAHRESLRAQYRFHQAWGLDILDREAYLWGHSSQFAPGWTGWKERLLQPLHDRLRNRLRLSAYRLGRDTLRGYLRRIARFRPRSLYGYPSAIDLLAREAAATGFVCDSLRLIRLTGEPALPGMIRRIQRSLHAPAAVEYGSHECGLTANGMPDGTLRVREDRIIAETVPCDGGWYDIVLTVLANPSFPLFRYAIADRTSAPLRLPDHGFAVLADVVGRSNDLVITRRGEAVHSSRLDALFKYRTRAVRRFRVMQESGGALNVALEVDPDAPRPDVEGMEAEIRDLVHGYPVRIELVDELPVTEAGKHRMVASEMALPTSGDGP